MYTYKYIESEKEIFEDVFLLEPGIKWKKQHMHFNKIKHTDI